MTSNRSPADRSTGVSTIEVPVEEVIEEALVGIRSQLEGRRVSIFVEPGLPLVRVDLEETVIALRAALSETVSAALPPAEVLVSASIWMGTVEIRVGERDAAALASPVVTAEPV